MLHQQPTVEEMQRALAATRLSPADHFTRMVKSGIIDNEGRVTKLIGGDAEPEPGACRPSDQSGDSGAAE